MVEFGRVLTQGTNKDILSMFNDEVVTIVNKNDSCFSVINRIEDFLGVFSSEPSIY